MKNIYILFVLLCCSSITNAQLVDIAYSVKTINITSYEGGDCYEAGDEEYTGILDSWDNVLATVVTTGCKTCDNNGNCTYAADLALQTRTSALATVSFRIDAWESDNDGSGCGRNRCAYSGGGGCCNVCTSYYFDDECHRNETNTLNIRETRLPSIGTIWTATPTWGGTNNHQYSFNYTWLYSDATVDITPTTTATNAAYTSTGIKSWVASLTSGRLYRFTTTGAEATQINIYAADGYTLVASVSNAGGAAILDFRPCTTGNYFVEVSHAGRIALTTAANLQHSYSTPVASIAPTSITATRTTVYTCDNAVTLTVNGGNKGSLGQWVWYAGSCSGTSIGTGTSINVTPASNTTYYVRAEAPCQTPTGCAQQAITVSAPPAVSTTASQWNVACFNGDNFNTYYGYYNQTSLDFNTGTRWTNSPSDANATGGAAYTGCPIPVDNHSYNYKRTNFPCGIYDINILTHDDFTEILVNGVSRFNHSTGCCDAHSAAVKTFLSSADVVEIKTKEGGGGSNTSVTFTTGVPVTTAATAQTCAVSGYQANWNAVVGATSYIIDIANNAGFSPMLFSGNVGNVTSYNIDFTPGITYYYRVRAVDCITSGNSNVTSILPPALSNDYIANATNMGILVESGSNISSGWDNNIGSTQEFGEVLHPDNESSNRTDWIMFTTDANPPATVNITGQESDWLDLDWRLYKLNDDSYTFPRCNVDWSKLTYIIDGDGGNNANCVACAGGSFGESNREVSCLEPNSKYYIAINGFFNSYALCIGSCDQEEGNYLITLDPNNVAIAPDNLCSAGTDLGTLNAGATITKNNFSNYCATRQTNEPNSSAGDETVWYQFTTGNTRTKRIDVDVDAIGGSGDGGTCVLGNVVGGWVRIYEQLNTVCPTNFANLSPALGSNNDITGITQDHWYFECMKPLTTYWIQVEALGGITCDKANFNVSISSSGIVPNNDQVCTATSIGTAATVATKVGTYTKDYIKDTTINGTNCQDANPAWNTIFCGAGPTDNNNYGVWLKFPAAANRTDIVIKGRSVSADNMGIMMALYPSTGINGCSSTGMSLMPKMTFTNQGSNGNANGNYYGPTASDGLLGVSQDEDHIYTCLDPNLDYYLLVDGSDVINPLDPEGIYEMDFYYPRELGDLPCNAVPFPKAVTAGWKDTLRNCANYCGTYTTGENKANFGDPDSYQNPVWAKFIAPPSGSVRLTIKSDPNNIGDEMKPEFFVVESSDNTCNLPSMYATQIEQFDPDDVLGSGADGDVWTERLDVRCLVPGRTYFVEVDGLGVTVGCGITDLRTGIFDLYIEDLAFNKNKNDSICGAKPGALASDPYHFTPTAAWKTVNYEAELTKNNENNYCATALNEPSASAAGWGGTWSPQGRGSWYSFVAPPSGKVEIELNNVSTSSDQINAEIAVYKIKAGNTCLDVQNAGTASGPSSLLEFYGSSNDTYVSSLSDEDLTVSCLQPDSLYYIYVAGVNGFSLSDNLGYGVFNLKLRSYPQDPAAKNDSKCNPIYLGQPENTTLGTGNSGRIFAQSSNFNRSSTILAGAPTLGVNGVTLVKATGNSGATVAISAPPGGSEVSLTCMPNAGCIDDNFSSGITDIIADYDRHLYPFNNFCATNTNDSLPSTWGSIFGLVNGTPKKSVWFMFKAPADLDGNGEETVMIEANQEITLTNANSDAIDLRLAVFESSDNTCNGNMYELASNYDAGFFDEDMRVPCLEPGRFYWLMVDGSNLNEEGYFGFEISRVAPDPRPSNDFICAAKPISNAIFNNGGANPVTFARDTSICARTTQTSIVSTLENIPTGFDIDHTVWYKFTTPAGASAYPSGLYAVKVDVNGYGPLPFGYSDKMDPQIAIYESQDNSCNWGTGGANMVEISSEYDILPFTESMIGYCLQPNKTYYVMVDGSGLNSQGYFDIKIDDYTPIDIVTNDDIANATSIAFPNTTGSSVTSALTHNYCTDTAVGEPDNLGIISDIDNTVWFKFTVPTTGSFALSSGVYPYVNCNINLRSDPGNTKNDKINLLGSLYEVQGGSSTGTFANITNVANGLDAGLGLFGLGFDETINVSCLVPGRTYYLQVDGFSGPLNIFRAQGQGFFDVQINAITTTPNNGNDSICGAPELTVGAGAGSYVPAGGSYYNNKCATTQSGEILPTTNPDKKTVWFKFKPPVSGNVTVTVDDQSSGDGIGAAVAIWQSQIPVTSTACPTIGTLALVKSEYDALLEGESVKVKCLDNATWAYIQVNSGDTPDFWSTGLFKIKIDNDGGVTSFPYNDNICNAKDFGSVTGATGAMKQVLADSNLCATIQVGPTAGFADDEPKTSTGTGCSVTDCMERTVWYKFTGPASGRAVVTITDADGTFGGIWPEMKLYQGSVSGCTIPSFNNFTLLDELNTYVPLGINDKIEYHCLIKDSVYYIQVDGTSAGKQGFFDLKIEDKIPTYNTTTGKPSNDDFAAAESITVNSEQCPVPIGTFSGQDIQGSGNWSTLNYKYPSIDKKNIVAGACNTNQNCGDIWYYFDMPTIDCTPGYSAVTIQGHSDQIGGISGNYNDLKIIAYSGNSLATLTPILCGESDGNPATNDYFNFEVAGSAGERIYLQVFDKNTNDTENDGDANESFQICVSQRKGMDLCTSLATQPNMQYGVDYCWNIKGASSEPISSSYGENSSTTDPTDNSVYYKFKMPSNICNDLKITFSQLPSSFLESGSTNANQRLSLTIYREDGTPCDGAPNSALINEFWQANSSSGVFYSTTINMSSFGLDTNKIYYIQIDGNTNDNGIVNDGIIRIDTIPKCFNFVANTRKDTSVGYDICSDGWRHYYTLNGGKQHIFSLYPNENNIEGEAKITYKAAGFDKAEDCGNIKAEYSMRRIWDFKITNGGTINASKPVKVRFYYRQEEKDAINNAANAFKSSCGGFIEDFEWFKTGAGIEYIPTNPSQINPDKITAGYSETGCQGSPLFGSIDGCDVITASDSLTSCNGIRYVELGQIFNFSGGTGATGVGPYDDVSPLPIELVSFIGYHNADNYTNNLNWVTAAEINSSRFVVEKSLDGASFSYLDEKPAAGNSITALSYNLVDTKPSLGDNYYRLKMIDKDGTFEYSRIINVNVGVGDAGSQILGIYPNPTRGMLNIRFLSGEKENFTMRVMNTTGQLVRENTFEFSAGINFIELNTFDFADGLYILQFVGENSGLFDGKFVKE